MVTRGKKLQKTFFIAVAFLLAFLPVMLAPAGQAQAAAATPALNLNVKSAILIEAKTGKVLYKQNENQPYAPASMTKMMTEYLVLEAIKNKKITWDQTVTADEYAAFLGKPGGSSVLLALGEQHTVRELYEAMAIYSANDATALLAKTVGGSEAEFVKTMNKKAKDFGMTQTYFATSSGFPLKDLKQFAPPSDRGDNVMSARDAAILAKELITTYPEVLETTKIPRKMFREGTPQALRMDNWNWMLPTLVKQYPGADGLKTGHTNDAGYCFTGTAERNGIRFIAVVMGTNSYLSRFSETAKLFDYGFSNYKMVPLLAKGSPVPGGETAPIVKGTDKEVELVTGQDILYPVRNGEEKAYKPKAVVKEAIAPITQGQALGTVKIVGANGQADDFLRPIDEQKAGGTLIAKNEVEEAGWLRLTFRAIIGFIGGLFGSFGDMIKGLF